ncbi:hypothetical protein PFISCL1PPCAC_19758, partial [Pristionchus fissidentatus]
QWLKNVVSFSRFLQQHLLSPLCVAGVLSNILIVAVLLRPSMRSNAFNHFLILIAFCDGSVMAMSLVFDSVDSCHHLFHTHKWISYTRVFGVSTVLIHSASLWLTVNMAILRYQSLRYMLLSRGSSSSSSFFSCLPPPNSPHAAILSIVVAVFVALFGSLLNFLRYEVCSHAVNNFTKMFKNVNISFSLDDKVRIYAFRPPQWWNCTYERTNFWIVAVVLKLLPCILLTIFMTLLVKTLMEARKRRERLTTSTSSNTNAERTTAMLTVIVAVFLVTELPQGIAQLAQGTYPQLRYAVTSLTNLFNMMSLINSATNFLLCVLMSAVFRKECLQMFSNCFPSCFASSPSRSNATTMLNLSSKNGFVPVPT